MVRVNIDSSGRVELPQALRDTAGWGDVRELVIRQHAGVLLVEPASRMDSVADDDVMAEASEQAAALLLPPEDFSAWPGFRESAAG